MLKKILIGIAALVVLVILGAVALVSLVDVDRYKPQIEQTVQDKLDRKLRFDGKLSLSLFPSIAVALPHTTLSERGSETAFLSLDRARVSLALWPLLSGKVEAGTVSLYGLRATIERHADGTTSVDDLTGAPTPAPGAAPPQNAARATAVPFEVGGIDLVDAQVVYHDERAHNTVTLSNLNLKTGRIATRSKTPVDLSASIASTEPPTSVDLSLKAVADIDLAGHAFGAHELAAQARGHFGADQFDVKLSSPGIVVDPTRAIGEQLKLLATVTGAHQARVDLTLDNLTAQDVNFSIEKVAGELDLESAALPQKSLKTSLTGSVRGDRRDQDVVARLAAQLDETQAAIRLNVHDFSNPHLGFDIDVDRLNLDRYLPPPAPAAQGGAGAGAAPAASGADQKVDLSALKRLNLAGEVRIGALQVHNVKAAKIKVGVHAAGGRLEVAPVTASLYEGSLSASSKVDADGNRIAVNATLDGISIEPLLKDLMGKDILEGHGGVKMNVTTAGPTVAGMRRALGGTASLALRDGAVHGINIAQKLRDLKGTLTGGSTQTQAASSAEKTDFSELTASFTIRNGVASNSDLLAKSPLLRVNGAGTIDIGAGSLDYTAQAAVVGTLAGQGGAELSSLHGVTVPVHLFGPFTALSYQLDWGSLARQAVKSRAAEQLKGLLGGKSKQGTQSPAPNPADVLKGLLGK